MTLQSVRGIGPPAYARVGFWPIASVGRLPVLRDVDDVHPLRALEVGQRLTRRSAPTPMNRDRSATRLNLRLLRSGGVTFVVSIEPSRAPGSLDGNGAGDCDREYRLIGWRPRVAAPYPFTTRELARLMILRSRIQDRQVAGNDWTEWP